MYLDIFAFAWVIKKSKKHDRYCLYSGFWFKRSFDCVPTGTKTHSDGELISTKTLDCWNKIFDIQYITLFYGW